MDGDNKDKIVVFSAKKRFNLPKISNPFKKSPTKSPKRITGIIVLVIIGLLAGGIYTLVTLRKAPEISGLCKRQASSPIYKDAVRYLDAGRTTKLKDVVNKIKNQEQYDKDPNCLYPVVSYYLFMHDADNARKNYDLLEKAYNSKKGFSKDYGPAVASLSSLKQRTENTEKQNADLDKNNNVWLNYYKAQNKK